MTLKLYGSTASPFVRRIRCQLKDRDYEFIKINIFDSADRESLKKVSPHMRIPILVDGEKVLWDSTIIAEYLQDTPICIEEKLNLNLINELTDSGLMLFQLRMFKLDPSEESRLHSLQQSRVSNVLSYLEFQLEKMSERSKEWLYMTLDWFDYREVLDWRTNHTSLLKFFDNYTPSKWLKESDPRG
jgi:glutathione S-transferase